MKKTCKDCGKEKDTKKFYARKDTKDGLRSYCKECDNRRNRAWYDRNPGARKKSIAKHYAKIRREALEALGGKCVSCGFDDPRALQIDHIHRRKGKRQTHALYRKVARGEIKGLQLLCANCNAIKKFENKEHDKL